MLQSLTHCKHLKIDKLDFFYCYYFLLLLPDKASNVFLSTSLGVVLSILRQFHISLQILKVILKSTSAKYLVFLKPD